MKFTSKTVLMLIFIMSQSFAQNSGYFDSEFNFGNTLYLFVPNPGEKFYDLAVQEDNKIVVAGYSRGLLGDGIDYSYTVFRIKENGSIDSTFGDNGLALFGEGKATAVEIQGDGKILVVGTMTEGVSLARLDTDGNLDTSFGTDGVLVIPMSTVFKFGIINDIEILSSGKIMLTGYLGDGSNNNLLVIRLNEDGAVDSEFGNSGYIEMYIGSTVDQGDYILEQSDSKIIIVGQTYYHLFAARFNADGSLDESYGESGKIVTDLKVDQTSGDKFKGRLQSNDDLVVAGYSPDPNKHNSSNYTAVRILSNGTIDVSFGSDGYVNIDFDESQNQDWAYDVLISEQGKILLGGSYTNSNNFANLGILALNSDGSVDESFGVNGRASALGYAIKSLSFDEKQRIVAGGYSTQGRGYAVARFIFSQDVTSVNQENKNLPGDYTLSQNYPNPFNPSTVIKYQLKSPGFVKLKVYDILGREISTLVNEYKNAGDYSLPFDANSIDGGLSSGVYIYKLQVNDFVDVKKMLLTK